MLFKGVSLRVAFHKLTASPPSQVLLHHQGDMLFKGVNLRMAMYQLSGFLLLQVLLHHQGDKLFKGVDDQRMGICQLSVFLLLQMLLHLQAVMLVQGVKQRLAIHKLTASLLSQVLLPDQGDLLFKVSSSACLRPLNPSTSSAVHGCCRCCCITRALCSFQCADSAWPTARPACFCWCRCCCITRATRCSRA